jgi:hypothetical protein
VCRLFEFVLRMFDGFVDAGTIVNFDPFTQADDLDSQVNSRAFALLDRHLQSRDTGFQLRPGAGR